MTDLKGSFLTSFSPTLWADLNGRKRLISKYQHGRLPPRLEPKVFQQVHTEIPVLSNYHGKLPAQYWSCWTKRSVQSLVQTRSWVQEDEVRNLAAKVDFPDKARLERVLARIKDGAELRCEGAARLPTKMPNNPSVYKYGVRVADILQDMIKDGLVWGPLLPEEVPWRDYTINPLQTKIKPNSKVRPIVNMSSPYIKKGDPANKPSSVNSGIKKAKTPATMGSSRSFIMSLARAGCPAEMCKLDWVAGKTPAIN